MNGGLHTWRWRLVAAWIVVFTLVAAWNFHRATEARRETRQLALGAHVAICAFRGDLEQRVKSSRLFLKTHPHGFDGITSGTIRLGIQNTQRTIATLSNLNCEDVKK